MSCLAGPLSPALLNAQAVQCEGEYKQHLQGICRDQTHLFWSFTDRLVKSNHQGKVEQAISVPSHHGDLCLAGKQLFVAVELGQFNQPEGKSDPWIYVYGSDTLELQEKHQVKECIHGAGGVTTDGEHFFVVGGLPEATPHNLVVEYDRSFNLVKKHQLDSGYTLMGIQTAEFFDDHFWFGCYGSPSILLKADQELNVVKRFEFDAALGITQFGADRLLVARRVSLEDGLQTGKLLQAKPDRESGLVLVPDDEASFEIERHVVLEGYDGKSCWVHPRAGHIPGEHASVVMTMLRLDVKGSDLFSPTWDVWTDNQGMSWSEPKEYREALGQRNEPNDVIWGVCDFTPKWHAKSKQLLAIGQTVRYQNNRVVPDRKREIAYAVYNHEQRTWNEWKTVQMPDEARFYSSGSGSAQRVDLEDGTILLPVYHKPQGTDDYSSSVIRCSFDGSELRVLEVGNELELEGGRGFAEPSLIKFRDRFYLTIRNNERGYVSTSKDGLHFERPKQWTFDDGKELGSYNTQQHWVKHDDKLFLVYTRKGADNDHVFRHRAPLFIAEVDPEQLHVKRETERVVVPEKGARLGNFGVTVINDDEVWITVAEWMQTWSRPSPVLPVDNPYGANNRVWLVKLKW